MIFTGYLVQTDRSHSIWLPTSYLQ